MIGRFEGIESSIFARFSGFIFYSKSSISNLLPGVRMPILVKNVPQVVYYQKQVVDFWAVFLREQPLAPGLSSYFCKYVSICSCYFATNQ